MNIWAFGIVLFEMVSGRRPFAGENVADVLGAVLRSEPDWASLPKHMLPRVRLVIQACLQKDLSRRLAHFQDVRLVLDGTFDPTTDLAITGRIAGRRMSWQTAALIATVLAALVLAALLYRRSTPDERIVVRFSINLPAGLELRGEGRAVLAVSPDGQRIVFNTNWGLYLRSLNEPEGQLLPGSEEALSHPFFSHDGRSVGYFQAGHLKRLPLTGGAPSVIAAASNPFGVSWTADDTVYFGQPEGIMRVPARGGTPELVVPSGNGGQMDGPQLLPGGDSLLFSVAAPTSLPVNRWDSAEIVVQSLRSQTRKVLVRGGSDARFIPPGYLLYAVEDRLLAARFDPSGPELRGEAIAIVDGLSRAFLTASANVASAGGSLFYLVGTGAAGSSGLTWVDRDGRTEPITTIEPRRFSAPRLSPDGRHVLVQADGDAHVFELATGRETRVTADGRTRGFAAWRHDGAIAYSSTKSEPDGQVNVWIQAPGGTGDDTRLTAMTGQVDVDSWAPNGQILAVHHHPPGGGSDVLMIPINDHRPATPLPYQAEPALEQSAVFSADGRFVAYLSAETGRYEAYIRPFSGPGARQPVSVGGASDLTWARNGELFYRRVEDNVIVAVPITTTPALTIGQPRSLFRVAGLLYGVAATRYDVTADGQRFLLLGSEVDPKRVGPGVRPSIHVVLNWLEELALLLPGL